jgi:PPOX class probable F420-dependent enzyme
VAGIRDRIRMDPARLAAFLGEERTVTCATIGRDGAPHLMPLWYVVRGEDLWAWTYGTSQKVRNLERDPRATLQVEAGEAYEELRGAMLVCAVTIHRDAAVVEGLGAELARRYGLPSDPTSVRTAGRKRVALEFRPVRVASWDHRLFAVGRSASR